MLVPIRSAMTSAQIRLQDVVTKCYNVTRNYTRVYCLTECYASNVSYKKRGKIEMLSVTSTGSFDRMYVLSSEMHTRLHTIWFEMFVEWFSLVSGTLSFVFMSW